MINLKKHWSLDVEADGPVPGLYSMVSFGFVNVEDTSIAYYGELAPISMDYQDEALDVCNMTREQTLGFKDASLIISEFSDFLDMHCGGNRPITWSDNPGFDWGFLNYYMHRFTGDNRLGWSCRRIGDLYSGQMQDLRNTRWRKYRNTQHTHNAMDDARGNAEALKTFIHKGNYK